MTLPRRTVPTAPTCEDTLCEGVCVDITTDSFNCGGCGMACDSPGQICNGSLPCGCPDPSIPADVSPAFPQTFEQDGIWVAAGPIFGSPVNVLLIVSGATVETGVDYDLSELVGTLTPPGVGFGYDIDFESFTYQTPYAAVQGIVNFTETCPDGASGTITGDPTIKFVEVEDPTNPQPLVGGCEVETDSITFSIGSCATGPDAGPTDGGSI